MLLDCGKICRQALTDFFWGILFITIAFQTMLNTRIIVFSVYPFRKYALFFRICAAESVQFKSWFWDTENVASEYWRNWCKSLYIWWLIFTDFMRLVSRERSHGSLNGRIGGKHTAIKSATRPFTVRDRGESTHVLKKNTDRKTTNVPRRASGLN